MSTSACQGLQSCLDPCLVEPRVLRLKLSPPKSTPPSSSSAPTGSRPFNDHACDWSFINPTLDLNGTKARACDEMKNVYVHPRIKRSSSILSEKSLEMCTESLGSETGTVDPSEAKFETLHPLPTKPREPKKHNRAASFPPPLRSISGPTGVRVQPHREGGRLVLEAVAVPSCHNFFCVDRSDGRLRLWFVDEDEDENEHDGGGGAEAGEEEEEQNVGEGEVEENYGGETGKEKFPRPSSRCKEGGQGNKGLLNWKPCWVAT